jgi:hypothetical protein
LVSRYNIRVREIAQKSRLPSRFTARRMRPCGDDAVGPRQRPQELRT